MEFDKQPAETYPIAFEYYGKLPAGTSLASAVGSAYNVTDSVDATAAVLHVTAGVIQGTRAIFRVKAGTTGKVYKITSKATLSDGSLLEDEIQMNVTEL